MFLIVFIVTIIISLYLLSLSTRIVIGHPATISSCFLVFIVSIIFSIIIAAAFVVGSLMLETGIDQFNADRIEDVVESWRDGEGMYLGIGIYGGQFIAMTLSVWAFISTDRSTVRPGLGASFLITILYTIISFVVFIGIFFVFGLLIAQQGAL